MRLLGLGAALFFLACGSDNATPADMASQACSPLLMQGGTCNPATDHDCVSAGLNCSCQCGALWICGLTIACDMGTSQAHDLARPHD